MTLFFTELVLSSETDMTENLAESVGILVRKGDETKVKQFSFRPQDSYGNLEHFLEEKTRASQLFIPKKGKSILQ